MSDLVVPQEAFDQKVQDFGRQRQAVFEGLTKELQHAVAAPAEADFGRIVSHAQHVLGKNDLQMSMMFKISRPTLNRWTRGKTAPHHMLRKAVFDALLAEVRRALKGHRASA